MAYCQSRFRTVRRLTREVAVGAVRVGGSNPIRVQSMTTSDTQDVAATVRQSVALAEVGCEIVRVTAPNVQAARCLRDIRAGLTSAGWGSVPIVADIHFLPQAAMEAVEHVEKVRVNPGNYADKKRFAVRDYSDADYERELQRLHEAFSPLVRRSKELGRSMRIGTNHGSLSDRIMNRYGDTPLGMVESALEFLRIAESHGYREIILSMKSSNPKVMIEAYRLLVDRMDREAMHYPLHLGVTEAGDGEDGRIKGSIGIGSLLMDGLGDTIRVSLTEDSVYEIPVAKALAAKAMSLWSGDAPLSPESDSIDPYHFDRRVAEADLGAAAIGPEQPPRVIVRAADGRLADVLGQLSSPLLKDTPAEGILFQADDASSLQAAAAALAASPWAPPLVLLQTQSPEPPAFECARGKVVLVRRFGADAGELRSWAAHARERGQLLCLDETPADLEGFAPVLAELGDQGILVTCSELEAGCLDHPAGAYRRIAEVLRSVGSRAPLWIRNTAPLAVRPEATFLSRLIDASLLTGSLLCDGLGDLVSIETEADVARSVRLA
ncbi:MAG TPA: (E)-4-hydroxy-3-methylbut-2-enyl-diphosphate synthase, partial [Opitutaceae bacterium]